MIDRFVLGRRSGLLFKDEERGILLGVCAGLGGYLGVSPWVMRAGAIVLVSFLPVALSVAYIVAGFTLSNRPLLWSNTVEEKEIWKQDTKRSQR